MWLRLAALMAVVLAASTSARTVERAWDSPTAEAQANARREEIRAEVQALGTHDWAGEYYAGDGTGFNTYLSLAPRVGYVFEWHGCMGLYDRDYGSVTSTDRSLRLSFTFDGSREGFWGIAPELTVVRWGDRRYLVPADEVIDFCNSVNQGREPRTDEHGRHLLRVGDEAKKVRGSPELPPEYQSCLLSSPVEAEVSAVGASTLRPLADGEFGSRDTVVTLDAGRRQGLVVGMDLIVTRPENTVQSVEITNLEDDRAEGTITQLLEDDPVPEVGWRVSTRAPWNDPLMRFLFHLLGD